MEVPKITEQEIIVTKIFTSRKNNAELVEKRIKRIEEAIAFDGDDFENQQKHSISLLPNGKESYFLKPGKETLRKEPNEYDMSPNVGINRISETENWAFENIWEYLIKISIISQSTFKKVLILLYRICFMLDHQEVARGKFRYLPSEKIMDYINNLEKFVLTDGFMDKFKMEEIGLLEFLHFIDLLGWNEDVKYHIVNGQPKFNKDNKKVGRINAILSIVSAPLLINNFILEVIKKTESKGIIDVKLITSTIQMFSKSRGLCVLPNRELLKHLHPYLQEK